MDNVRYRMATTARKSKGSSYETTGAMVNAAASSRPLAPSTGDCDNYHHPGRRQWSRRRDIYAVPDDAMRVSTLSPPMAAVADAIRRREDNSDVFGKSSAFWAQPAGGSGTAARSRSRPRPPFVLERRVQRDGISDDYLRDSEVSNRYVDQQVTDEYERHRRRQHQQQQQQHHHHATGLTPSVEFSTRRSADSRPQVYPNLTSLRTSDQTVTSSTLAPLSPSYLNDNKTLLKEALMSAAAAKLARSSSARSAAVRPLVVIRNGPPKSSSDEHVDVDNDATTRTGRVGPASPVTPESLEHTADVAMAAAAAAAAAATRRSRTRRKDADQTANGSMTVTSSSAASGTSVEDKPATRRIRPVNRDAVAGDQVSRSNVAISSALGSCDVRRTNCDSSSSVVAQTSPSSNCNHVDGSRRSATLLSTPGVDKSNTGKPHVSETPSTTKKTERSAGDGRKDRLSASDTVQQVDKTVHDASVNDHAATTVTDDSEARHESPSSTSKVSFIKSILSRTRSPSPRSVRRSRSRVTQTSSSPSSVLRLGAEVAQRIGEPVKGYLKQLRDRSSQRRRIGRTTEPDADSNKKTSGKPEPCQDHERASAVDSQSRSGNASCDTSSTETMSNRGRRSETDWKKKTDNGAPSLTTQWKSRRS